MQSNVCTKNLSGGSTPNFSCPPPTPPRCCSGRCSLQDRSTCARWMVGRRSPQNPLISRLTLPPETIPSCYRRLRHTKFQPHSGRHPGIHRNLDFANAIQKSVVEFSYTRFEQILRPSPAYAVDDLVPIFPCCEKL